MCSLQKYFEMLDRPRINELGRVMSKDKLQIDVLVCNL